MRVWEVDETREIPSDLVREQDFIMRIRRLARHSFPCLVVNLILNAVEALSKNQTVLQEFQKKIQEAAQAAGGSYHEMSNGDVFIVWEQPAATAVAAADALTKILAEHVADNKKVAITYHLPDQYNALRERSNHYVEVVRAASLTSPAEGTADKVKGRLSAKSIEQIEDILGGIDLRRYARTQNIYKNVAGAWQKVGEEYFISFVDLRRERFPKLEIIAPEHFFFALCEIIDQHLFEMLTKTRETLFSHMVNLNVSVATITTDMFAKFVHTIAHEHRSLIGFELNCGDLFQDFSLTLSMMQTIKKEGFRVVLDGVTPDMFGYLDVGAFPVDTIKVNVAKERAAQLAAPSVRKQLEKLNPDKTVFYRCDSKDALAAGQQLGISVFQGWLIDDLAGDKKKP